MSDSEHTVVAFKFTQDALNALDALMVQNGMGSRSETVRHALALYDTATQAMGDGAKGIYAIIEDDKGDLESVKLYPFAPESHKPEEAPTTVAVPIDEFVRLTEDAQNWRNERNFIPPEPMGG